MQHSLTHNGMVEMLSAEKGARIVTITAKTTPNMRKTNNPFYNQREKAFTVSKVSRVNGMINWSYENSVNNQRAREGHGDAFEAHPRTWGQRIQGTPFVHHMKKDGSIKRYLEVKVERSLGHFYMDEYGKEIDAALVQPWLVDASPSRRQETEKEIILRDYALESIIGLVHKGTNYIVI
jgi:hypothetical protein